MESLPGAGERDSVVQFLNNLADGLENIKNHLLPKTSMVTIQEQFANKENKLWAWKKNCVTTFCQAQI